jgi:hypothetical protein
MHCHPAHQVAALDLRGCFGVRLFALMAVLGAAVSIADESALQTQAGESPAANGDREDVDVTEMADLPIVLRDEQGDPVVGAEVRAYAMRMREGEGHGYWDDKIHGPPRTVLSDQNGRAVIQYPVRVRLGPQVMTTRLVSFSVAHAEFVSETVHFELGPDEALVTLTAGCEVTLSAVDADRHSLDDFGVLMAGRYSPTLWAKVEDGGRRSRAVKDGTWQTMLVKLPDDGPTLFSNVLPLRVRPQQTVRFRNIPLRRGARLRGTLSDNVPRPVTGYVIATSAPWPGENSWSDENPSLVWHDWVDIAPDGSFEFASLPRSGEVQLIAVCDGWLSTTVSDEPVAGSFVMGQVFPVDEEEVSVVLAMEPTGTLAISLVRTDGQPFTEGRVSSWPNQRYLRGGSTLLGQRLRSEIGVRNQLVPPDERMPLYETDLELPFIKDVDPEGTVWLTGLPIGSQQQLVLTHDTHQFGGANERLGVQYTLDNSEPVRKRMRVMRARH